MDEKGAYERKFDASSKVDENLKRNLLLIRETFKVFCETVPFSVTDLKEVWQEDSEFYEQTNEQNREPFLKNLETDADWNKTHDITASLGMTVFYKSLGIYDGDSVATLTEEIKENLKNELTKALTEKDKENLKKAAEKKIKNIKSHELKIAADIYSKIIDGNILKKHYNSIKERLMDAKLPERYIKPTRTVLICAGNKIGESVDAYFNIEGNEKIDENNKRAEKNRVLKNLQGDIRDAWSKGDRKICMLVLVVYNLIYLTFPNEAYDLHTAHEVLEKVLENNLPKNVKNSSSYAQYITTLAKSVISVEEEFPNFYALTQQMAQKKSSQSIMNETTKLLKQLQNDMKITKSDAESTSCQNMMNEISKVMLEIQQVLESESKQKNHVK